MLKTGLKAPEDKCEMEAKLKNWQRNTLLTYLKSNSMF